MSFLRPESRRRHNRMAATSMAVALGAGVLLVGCRSSSNDATNATVATPPPFSVTVPPNYSGSIPGLGAPPTSDDTLPGGVTVPTSVQPENEGFCQEVQKSSGLFSAPAAGTDDQQALRQIKETFTRLADLAPSKIKPEVQGMSNTIQSMSSANDISKLDDPLFTAEQERFAQFVMDDCGFELPG